MTRVRYNTSAWTRSTRYVCALCSRADHVVFHDGVPEYAAQSLPSGQMLYACRQPRDEFEQRLLDDHVDRQVALHGCKEPVVTREPYLTEGPAHVVGSTLSRRGRR